MWAGRKGVKFDVHSRFGLLVGHIVVRPILPCCHSILLRWVNHRWADQSQSGSGPCVRYRSSPTRGYLGSQA